MLTAKLFYSQQESTLTFEPGESLASVLIRSGVAGSDVSWSASTVFVGGKAVENPQEFTLREGDDSIVVGKLRTHG